MQDHRLILLKEKGYRVTLPRQEILKALKSYPQSAKEIYKKVFDINLATIYRTLDFFFSEGIVTKAQLDAKTTKYEFNNKDNHHHHLICEKCGVIKDISIDDDMFLGAISNKANFSIRKHTLELWGLCQKCMQHKQ